MLSSSTIVAWRRFVVLDFVAVRGKRTTKRTTNSLQATIVLEVSVVAARALRGVVHTGANAADLLGQRSRAGVAARGKAATKSLWGRC